MTKIIVVTVTVAVAVALGVSAVRLAAQQRPGVARGSAPPARGTGSQSQVDDGQAKAELMVMDTMAEHHMHDNPHLRVTQRIPERPGDRTRAAAIVSALRPALERFRDHHVALRSGYEIMLPDVVQPLYHFNNYAKGFAETFLFRPDQPTSLLYRKSQGNYRLVGAMYTAPRRDQVADLDARVPLSIAQWHAHVNICLPRQGAAATSDWSLFGPAGSITTADACAAAGGRFFAQLFGWMVHVYPFEKTVEKIWAME